MAHSYQVGEQISEHAQLDFVKDVNNEFLKKVNTKFAEDLWKRVLKNI